MPSRRSPPACSPCRRRAGEFALIVVGEIAFGVGIGWVSLRLRRWARDPRVEITLSLMTPYIAFLVPANLGGSGVLATVAAGLFVSWNGPLLIPAATRLQGIFFWDLIVYYLEGFIFLVTGMETRDLIDRPNVVSLRELGLALLVTVAVIVVARFVWVYPATYLPRWLSPSLRRRDPVSALAMDLPAGLRRRARCRFACRGAGAAADHVCRGASFRTAISFCSSLSASSSSRWSARASMLPGVVRWLSLAARRRRRAPARARRRIYGADRGFERGARAASTSLQPTAKYRPRCWRSCARAMITAPGSCRKTPTSREAVAAAAELRAELIAAEREYIYRLLQEGQITDEARRRIERELDLEEASLAFKRDSVDDPPL